MLHQVLKKFKAEGRELVRGEIIETSHWKNERLLLEHKLIGKPSVPQDEAENVKAGNKIVHNSMSSEAVSKAKPSKPKTVPKATSRVAKPAVLKAGAGAAKAIGKVPVAKG